MLHTGQHYDRELSQVFFEELGLAEPRYRLDLRTRRHRRRCRPGSRRRSAPSGPTGCSSTATRTRRSPARSRRRRSSCPLAHVEAGLRSGDRSMPEERNRIEVDRLAQLLLCPDERSRENLAGEGVPGRAEVVGDVMADATRLFAPIARERLAIAARCDEPLRRADASTARRTPSPSGCGGSSTALNATRLDRSSSRCTRARARRWTSTGSSRPRSSTRSSRSATSTCSRSSPAQARVSSPTRAACRRRPTGYGCRASPCGPRPSGSTRSWPARTRSSTDDPRRRSARRSPSAALPRRTRPTLYGDGHAAERDR